MKNTINKEMARKLRLENTALSPELVSAYEATYFHVKADPAFILVIGSKSNELEMLFNSSGYKTAAFITASNPFSKSLSDEENLLRNNQLRSDLITMSLEFIEGFGQDPLGEWPGEDSYLVMGIDYETASELGVKYEQNGIVLIDNNATPELILLR